MRKKITDAVKIYQNYIYQFHWKGNVFVGALKTPMGP
jgi:hypothetical protein